MGAGTPEASALMSADNGAAAPAHGSNLLSALFPITEDDSRHSEALGTIAFCPRRIS